WGLVAHALYNPAALAADTSIAHVENLHCGFQLISVKSDEVRIRRISEDNSLLLHDFINGLKVIAQACRAFKLQCFRCFLHLCRELAYHRAGVAVHKRDQLINSIAVLVLAHSPNTRCIALADIAQKTRSAKAFVPVVYALGARAHGKDARE